MKDSTSKFDAEKFIENLLRNGSQIPCDNTNEKYNNYKLPPDFDEKKFKRGQRFYNDNIFNLFVGKVAGLITIISVPSILRILIFTNMSSTPFTAYKRYVATIFHMHVWYSNDFKPGSTLWKSMEEVRKKHNIASKRRACIGASRITQLDMALTQFGFMGFALTNPLQIGLHNPDPEAMESWVYLWRVVGDLMGIEDRFNICRLSLAETRAVCTLLVEKCFKARLEEAHPEFLRMATVLVEGMKVIQPVLMPDIAYIKILSMTSPSSRKFKDEFAKLTPNQLWYYNVPDIVTNLTKHRLWRWYFNMTMHVSLWLMKYFPFLALWKYGLIDGYVRIMRQPVHVSSGRNLYKSG